MKKRYLHVFAEVRNSSLVLEIPEGATEDEVTQMGDDALDTLISNGDTGWDEIDEAKAKKLEKAR